MMLLGAVSAMSMGFTACSDDDDNPPAQSDVKINITQAIDFETLVSEGTFEVPVTITGNDKAPKASDFHIMPKSTSFSNMILDWDTATPADTDQPWTKPAGLSVSSITAGAKNNSYILTVKYDANGVMDAEYDDCYLMYGTATSSNSFDFEYEGLAQESIGMNPVTYSKADGSSLSITIDDALAQLGITLDKFSELYRSLYVGVRNGYELELMKSSEFSHEYNAFPSSGFGFENDGTVTRSFIKVSGIGNLPVGQIFELHLIIRTEPGKYVAVNAPFMLTE